MSVLIFILIAGIGLVLTTATGSPAWVAGAAVIGVLAALSPRVAQQWERAVVLRLGGSSVCRGPGSSGSCRSSTWSPASIDQRVITTAFAAEQTLTMDTVPVNVDAVLFWVVHDPEKAALEVQNYPAAVSWAAQTALRDIIGRTSLADLLRGREKIEQELQTLIDRAIDAMGRHRPVRRDARHRHPQLAAGSDVARGAGLAREAGAHHPRRGRDRDRQVVRDGGAASYQNNPTALHLRAMNMLYEGLKEKGALMLIPSTAVESMGMGGMLGAAALQQVRLTGEGELK